MPFGSAQSLITRCPDCATAFRASAEQLSVRHGQVRCGRCGRVFDARAHVVEAEAAPAAEEHAGEVDEDARNGEFGTLRDSSDGAPLAAAEAETPDRPVTDTEPAPEESETSAAADELGSDDPGRDDGDRDTPDAEVLEEACAEHLDDEDQPDEPPTAPEEEQQDDSADGTDEPVQDDFTASSSDGDANNGDYSDSPTSAADAQDPADTSATADLPDDRRDPIDVAAADMPPSTTVAATTATPHVASTVEPLELEFGAPRNARPGVSKWVGIPAVMLLLMVLAGQIAYHLRGDLVLLFPTVRATAVQLCDWAGCDLPSPQRAELMSIEASDLQADSINPAVMVLSATLRNRAPFAQAQPALELTLTDAQDQPVARRVINAGDYVIAGIQNGIFPASSELPVKIYFEASAVKATGYRLYLFYP